MKLHRLPLIVLSVVLAGLVAVPLLATTFTYVDNTINWLGYPHAPFHVVTVDAIGSNPKVSGVEIATDDNGWLQSIKVFEDLNHFRSTETIFINAEWNHSGAYDTWDYLFAPAFNPVKGVQGVGPVIGYNVNAGFDYGDYALVPYQNDRFGHPATILPDMLTRNNNLLVGRTFAGGASIYTFQPQAIRLFDTANPSFVVGVSQDCGNDVFLSPVSPVPEPTILMLLGAGLLGLGGVGGIVRRRFKK